MKKILMIFFLIVSKTAFCLPGDIVYDPVVDASIGAMHTSMVGQFGIEIGKIVDEIGRLDTQIKQLNQELAQLGNYNWNTSQNKINELGGIVSKGNTLAYSASNINEKFSATYPGYKPPTNYSDHYKDIVNTTQNTLNQILQSMGSSASDFENENTRLKMLQDQAQNADGQTKAMQAASQIASAEVEQLQLLRQTVIAQTNAQTAYYAAETQKEASKKAAFDSLLNDSSHNVTGKLNENPINNDPFSK
jgi:type IV secretion system protein TrbJ